MGNNGVATGPSVIEFFGLPGAGKSTITQQLVSYLGEANYQVRTMEDVVLWVSTLTVSRKLILLMSRPGRTILQLFWCLRFGFSLRPWRAMSLSHIFLVPYVNLCVEKYLATQGNAVVVMEQANTQSIWSIGALADRYDQALLRRVNEVMLSGYRHCVVCLTPNATQAVRRIQKRTSSQSRFDGLQGDALQQRLQQASRLINDLRTALQENGVMVLDIDADLPPHKNAQLIVTQIFANPAFQ